MKVEIIRNGKKIGGPFEYDYQQIKDIVAKHGERVELVPGNFRTAVTIGSIKLLPVREVKPVLTSTQVAVFSNREEQAGAVVYNYIAQELTPDQLRSNLKRRLAHIHDIHEGYAVEHRGILLAVDQEARANSRDVLDDFQNGRTDPTEWRGRALPTDVLDASEYTSLPRAKISVANTAEMQAIRDAILGYIEKGFIARATVEAQIDAAADGDLRTFNVRGKFAEVINA